MWFLKLCYVWVYTITFLGEMQGGKDKNQIKNGGGEFVRDRLCKAVLDKFGQILGKGWDEWKRYVSWVRFRGNIIIIYKKCVIAILKIIW